MREKFLSLRGKRLFFTGGTGFFGKALLRYWTTPLGSATKPAKLTLLTRVPEKFIKANPELVDFSWMDFKQGNIESLEYTSSDGSYDAVLHAATDSTAGPSLKSIERYDQIVSGTRNVLNFAVAASAKRFLMTSSGGVYGKFPMGVDRIPEDYMGIPDPLVTTNAYSIAKRTAEHLCALYAEQHDVDVVIARCFAFVGRDLPLDVHFAIGNFIADAMNNREIIVKGDGSPVRSYLDQRDLAEWLIALMESGESGEAYNVGSDEAVRVSELAHLVRDILNPGGPVRILGIAPENVERNVYVPRIEKIRNRLNLMPRYSLGQSIKDVAIALREQTLS